MNWDDLRTFLAIARHGTLSGAARALGVSQPTMGRRLAAMEAESGARLLQRTPDGFLLTPLGESVLETAERMEAEALAAERLMCGGDVKLEGLVRITTVDTLASRIVAPALLAVQEAHPKIRFELAPATQSLSLSRRETDIAVRMTRFDGSQIVSRRIGTIALNCYARPSYLETADMDVPRLICLLEDQAHLPEAVWFQEQFPRGETVFRSNSREVLYWAALRGGGIAVLPRYRADAEQDLVRVLPARPDLKREIWLGVHSDMRQSPRIRATMDALIETFRAQAAWLDPDG
ncbi:MAG: LysR family transcriptional regulator [Hyphomonas sp.]